METNLSKEQKKVVKAVDKVMAGVYDAIPADWTKGQVAAMLGLLLELYW